MTGTNKSSSGFTDDERAAMQERAKELRANKADGETAVLEKIAAMKGSDHTIATRLHELVKTHAPSLKPKTWYGMPAYANADGKVVCFFQNAQKFKSRYATLGFSDVATLDDGAMWPTTYALEKLDAEQEAAVIKLLKRAVR